MQENPYLDHPSLAQAWDEGFSVGMAFPDEPVSTSDEAVLLQMSLGVGSLDGLKWVGVVPDSNVLEQTLKGEPFVIETHMHTWQQAYVFKGYDPALKAFVKEAASRYRNARLVYDTTIRTRRAIATANDGEIWTPYGEHKGLIE